MDTREKSLSHEDPRKIIGQVSAKAMVDEAFKNRLMMEPEPVLTEHGLDIPAGMKIEIMKSFEDVPAERSPNTLYLVIPEVEAMSHEELSTAMLAAASCQTTASTACTTPSCVSSASSASSNSCS
ncbi:hypothetical protein [Polyangium sp. y55x31]|uniref:hypothetical protein n=1 Tax=Polyangium sp. y55x31 TaxID=3042688 RepID=UPI0024829255|nr:hypothetical protein [Polyangium sp. y55x31]MDI1480106.1 hypothetical protein [Polyangium sp. y55x31]